MIANVAVVITTYNRVAQLTRCLWSIFEHGAVKPRVAVVVDDGSEDNTSEALAQLAQVYPLKWLRREREPGWRSPSIPRNMAIRMALDESPDYLILTEPEMLWMRDTLDLLLTRQYVEGRQKFVNAASQCFMNAPFEGEEWRNPESVFGGPESKVRRHFKQTAIRCGIMSPEAVVKVRGYDEWFGTGLPDENGIVSYGYGHDDTDFVTRMGTAGYEMIYAEEIKIVHQWHPPYFADAAAIDRTNLPHMQNNQQLGRYVVNGDDWGTDSGHYSWLATNPE